MNAKNRKQVYQILSDIFDKEIADKVASLKQKANTYPYETRCAEMDLASKYQLAEKKLVAAVDDYNKAIKLFQDLDISPRDIYVDIDSQINTYLENLTGDLSNNLVSLTLKSDYTLKFEVKTNTKEALTKLNKAEEVLKKNKIYYIRLQQDDKDMIYVTYPGHTDTEDALVTVTQEEPRHLTLYLGYDDPYEEYPAANDLNYAKDADYLVKIINLLKPYLG